MLGLSVVAVVAACTGPTGTQAASQGGGSADGDLSFAVVSHGTAGDAFWNVVKNGAEAAGEDQGVGVEYTSHGDPGDQARLIDNAVSQGVDGLVVSMANPDALKSSIQKAVDAGIPVITINSGEAQSAEFGALMHVGQSEDIAGKNAGERLKEVGKKQLLCVIHEAGNIGLNERCEGAKDGFGGNVKNLQVDISNPADTESRLRGALQSNSSIDAILTLNSQVAARAVSAVKSANSKAAIATFDLNSDVVDSISSGELLFAVDQQQYLQGYLPIVLLKLYQENANVVGGGLPVLTGPDLVDKDNVKAVGEYVGRGTR